MILQVEVEVIKKIRTQATVTQVPIDSPNPINSSSKHKNSIRSDVSSMLKSLSDAPTNLSRPENNSIITELQKYDASIYSSTDEKLILKYGPLLFFKENEKDYPILSEIAKMIFCLVPSSSPVESVLSITGNTQNKSRNRLNPNQLTNLTLLKMNR